MDIQINGDKFGLEIPALSTIVNEMRKEGHTQPRMQAYQKVLQANFQLIERVNAFLIKNGALTPFGGNPAGIGLISLDAKKDAPAGITFYGSEVLAQKLADAFPAYKVSHAFDGKVVVPAAPKASRQKPAGPKP